MRPEDYSPEMRKDIEARVAKAKKALEDLQLQPTANVQSINVGDDVFSQKVIVYLQDTRYKSPIQKGDIEAK